MTRCVGYSRAYDPHLKFLQMSDVYSSCDYSGDEPQAISFDWERAQSGQGPSFWGLRRFSHMRAYWLAQTLGWVDISWPHRIRNHNRSRAADHEFGSHGVDRRCGRKYSRRGYTSHHIPFCQEATQALTTTTASQRRRYLCVA